MMNLTPRINRLENNLIIDGGMEIWPEGTSRSVANNAAAYGSVLFHLNNGTSGVTLTNSQQASVPSNTNIPFSNQVSKTAAGTLAAGTTVMLSHVVEGYNVNSILRSDFSVIFWVKSSVASNRSLALNNVNNTHAYIKQYNIAQANTWEMKVLTFPALNTCPGTIDKTNGRGVTLRFGIVYGSNQQTATLNTWLSGGPLGGIGEDTTWLTGTNHDFNIAGVLLLPGDWSSLTSAQYQFVRAGKNFQDELEMTQRYFFKTYNLEDAPGTLTTKGVLTTNMAPNTGPTACHCTCPYPTRLRANPSITVYNASTGGTGSWRDSGGGDISVSFTDNGTMGTGVSNTGAVTTFRYLIGHLVADARF